jgi:hypothetical protein
MLHGIHIDRVARDAKRLGCGSNDLEPTLLFLLHS